MRDHLIHRYFGIDYEIVWDVVNREVPTLQREGEKSLPFSRRKRARQLMTPNHNHASSIFSIKWGDVG